MVHRPIAILVLLVAFLLPPSPAMAQPQTDCSRRPPITLESTYQRDPSSPLHRRFRISIRSEHPLGILAVTFAQVRNATAILPHVPSSYGQVPPPLVHRAQSPYVWYAPIHPLDEVQIEIEQTSKVFLSLVVTDGCGPWQTFWGAP